MTQASSAKIYLRVRRWVDFDLANQYRPASIFGPLVLVIAILFGAYRAGSVAIAVAWAVVVPIYAVWAGFVSWRCIRLVRAASIRSDRDYDQWGKFLGPPDYATSESYMKHRKRRRKQILHQTRQ